MACQIMAVYAVIIRSGGNALAVSDVGEYNDHAKHMDADSVPLHVQG